MGTAYSFSVAGVKEAIAHVLDEVIVDFSYPERYDLTFVSDWVIASLLYQAAQESGFKIDQGNLIKDDLLMTAWDEVAPVIMRDMRWLISTIPKGRNITVSCAVNGGTLYLVTRIADETDYDKRAVFTSTGLYA